MAADKALHAILVPLDGSEAGERALPVAARLARRCGAALHLATVVVPPPGPRPATESAEIAAALEQAGRCHAEEYLRRAAEAARGAHGLSVVPAVLSGPPATALAHHARVHHIDLIVMTSHGFGGSSRWWLGSVADRMLRRATVPVLLLPPRSGAPFTEFHRVLVAVGGDAMDETVSAWAQTLAAGSGATLQLVRVVPSPAALEPWGAERLARQTLEARRYLSRIAGPLERAGAQVHTRVDTAAGAAEAILRAADTMSPDLLAVGTHGAAGIERLVLGSVSDKIIRGAGRPVLIVPVAPE